MSKKAEYYLKIAKTIAEAGTCNRAQVGAVIVKNDAICSTWYNWAARWLPSCNSVWHHLVDWHCVRTLHSEENAIIQAARLGVSTYWATIYCTHHPCQMCIQRIINAWITTVIYEKEYNWEYFYSKDQYKNLEILQYKDWEFIKHL